MPDLRRAVEDALSDRPERNFVESVDVAVNLRDLDLSQPDQRVDEEVVLPSGTGKDVRVAVIADGETALQAEEVADRVIRPDQIGEIAGSDEAKKVAEEFDFFVAETRYMQDVGRELGRVLGPRGKMPSPLPPEDDVRDEVQRLKGTVSLRSGDNRTFHAQIGNEEMTADELADNVDAVLRRLTATLDKGDLNIDSVYVKTTMGPAVEVA